MLNQYKFVPLLILLILLFQITNPLQAKAAIALVQKIGQTTINNGFPETTTDANVTTAIAAGNSIIVTLATGYVSPGEAVSCSDSQGNTYNVDVNAHSPFDDPIRTVICSAHNIAALSNGDTITVTHPQAYRRAMMAHEFSGLAASSTIDQTADASGTGTNVSSGSTAATIQADELLIGPVGVNGPVTDSFTKDAAYAGLERAGSGGGASEKTLNFQYRVVSATGSYSATGTLGVSRDWAAGIASYKAATCTVTNTNDSGAGSLRDCITTANSNAGTTIEFDIPGPGNKSSGGDSWWEIKPNNALPPITADGTIIDATTQTANRGDTNTKGPEIEFEGSGAGSADGFLLQSANNEIKGFIISAFKQNNYAGVRIDGASATGNSISKNYIGTNFDGTGENDNYFGLYISGGADLNVIGGNNAAERNIISGNTLYGVYISGAGTDGNTISANYIGTDASGDNALQNGSFGIFLADSSSNSDIGGANAGEGNIISGNNATGIIIQNSNNNRIRGNTVGLDRIKTSKLANGGDGINITGTSDSNQIGGTGAHDGNTISGNSSSGILLDQVTNVDIFGNTIGAGSAIGNTTAGVAVLSADAGANINVGGVNSGEGNDIAFNGQEGIMIVGVVAGNDVDVDISGNMIANNGSNGFYSNASALTIAKNLIRDNGTTAAHHGIHLTSDVTSGKIYQNTIHNSAGDGLFIEGTASAIKNNIITGSGGYGINATGAVTAESNNLITDASTSPANSSGQANGITPDATDLNIDPQYNGSYSLIECSSLAINSGLDLGADQPDMNGDTAGKYNSTAPDMGAFETICSGSGSDLVIDNDFSDWCDGDGIEFCVDDEGGFNDWETPQQYDVTRFGVSSNRYDTFYLMFGFDEVSIGGGGSATGCILMDTTQPDNDNIDLVLCVGISGDPSAVDAIELYSCDDSIIGGCGSASLSKTYGVSDYGFDNGSNGPWDIDSLIEVALPFADLGIAGGDVVMTTFVSYPGNTFLKTPKDSIYETGGDQDYGQRVQYDTDDGTASTIPGPGLQSVSGTVYTDEGSTSIGSGKTVRLVVNGVDAGTDTTDAGGGYYISAPISDSDKILVYIDGDGTYKGTTATVFMEPNLIGFDIYADHLVVRHDNAGSLTVSDMNTAKGAFPDTDILYSLSGGNLLVNGSATELYIPTGHTFVPGADIDGAHLEILGSFTGGANTYNLSGDFTNGGTFTPDSSSVILDGTSPSISGSSTFYSLSKTVVSADTLTFEAGSTQTISNSLTLTGASGNLLSLRSSSSPTQWMLTVNAAATKNVDYVDVKDGDASASDGSHKALNPTNSVDSGNNIDWFGNILTWVGDAVNPNFNLPANWSPAATPTSIDRCIIESTNNHQPDLASNAECGTLTLGTAATVMTLSFSGNKNLAISGDVTIGAKGLVSPSGTPTGVFSIGGNWSDSIGTTNFTNLAILHLTFNFMGTSKTISTDETFYDVNITGNVTLNSDLTVDNSLTISNSSELIHGSNTIYLNGSFFQNGTYTHDCNSVLEVSSSITLNNNKHYPNIIISSGGTVGDGNPSYIDCDLTIQTGSTLTASGLLDVGGNWINNGGTVSNSGTVTMSGAAKEIGGTTATTFDSLTLGDESGDSTTAIYDLMVDDTFTVTAGASFTLLTDKNITVGNDAMIDGSLYLSGTTTWSQEGKAGGFNSGIQVASGGLLSAQGTDSANRVSFTRLTPDYYDFEVHGGLDLNFVDIYYTRSAGNNTGFSIQTPPAETLNFNNVAMDLTEDKGGAVMLYWDTNRTVNASNITFDSATYLLGDGDVNVEAKQGTINFTGYGGNYAGEANDFDNGGLANWLSGVGGAVYSDEGTTNIGAGKIVRLVVNGASLGTDTTDALGRYFISASPSAGDAVLVYIDGDDGAATDGTTVTVSGGGNLSGLDIYQDHLIVRHDNAGSLSNALISTAKGAYSDTEILFSVSGGNLTVSGSATELYIPSGHAFAPGGDVDSVHLENVGTLTGGVNSYNISGDWSNSGTFTADTSSVIFDGTNQAINGDTTFYDLTKSIVGPATLTFEAGSTQTIAAAGTITLHGEYLKLRSDTPGTRWNLTLIATAIKAIDYVDVKDSDASGSDASLLPVEPTNSVDSGNTIDWFPSEIVKKAFLSDGTALSSGTVLARGTTVKFLLYINNSGAAKSDISMADVLDASFAYQDNTIKVDNSVANCSASTCTPVEETGIYNAVNGTAYLAEDDEDGSLVAGYNVAGTKVTAGDQGTGANAQLDIGAGKVWAILFEVKIQ